MPHDAPGPRVIAGLAKIGLALKSHAWQQAGGRGLTPTQAQILTVLGARGQGGLRLSEVAEALAVTPATASDAVSALESKSLVRKRRQAADGRAVAISLTARGRREAARAAAWPDVLLEAVDELSENEQGALLRALTRIIRKLQLRGKIPVSRMCVTCSYFRPHVYPDRAAPYHCAFVDASFGDAALRIDCPDHVAASEDQAAGAWREFIHPERRPDHVV